jgi:2-polyprenyl-3-methyl-5-hydroxy-6-metoxy-1,4-benzoquinol methylase
LEAETEQERRKRRYQRTLFDGVAELYEAARPGYPGYVVEFVVTTAALHAGGNVLEVGCGTGQLTERLARSGFSLTAIDPGQSMIAAARRRLEDPAVSFQVVSFEDFAAAEGCFDLIISGCAFHWIDPEVKFSKVCSASAAGRLARPAGYRGALRRPLRNLAGRHVGRARRRRRSLAVPG